MARQTTNSGIHSPGLTNGEVVMWYEKGGPACRHRVCLWVPWRVLKRTARVRGHYGLVQNTPCLEVVHAQKQTDWIEFQQT